jgi:thiol-disulfide isomerase/thioredoxin
MPAGARVNPKLLFAGIGLLAALAGTALWLGAGAPARQTRNAVSPEAVFAAVFRDVAGAPQSLGRFQGKILVVNFWATWCAPCREEMPAFTRLQSRWAARNVQFVGLANDDPAKVERFARDLAINYPLWVGGEEIGELSKRLGNHLGVLPHTVILDPSGRVSEQKVGPYTEGMLEDRLTALVAAARSTSPNVGESPRK